MKQNYKGREKPPYGLACLCQTWSSLTTTAYRHSSSDPSSNARLGVPSNFVKSLKNMTLHVSQMSAVIWCQINSAHLGALGTDTRLALSSP
jgi:hypothetical protein